MTTSNKDLDPVISSDTSAQLDSTQASLESNLEHLSLEALRFICREMGVTDSSPKKEVIARLLKEGRARLGPEMPVDESESSGKEKDVQPQLLRNRNESFAKKLDAFQMASDRQAMSGSNFVQVPSWSAKLGALTLEDVEHKNMWKKRKLSKQRNQWEYNEWCKVGSFLDKALVSGDIGYVRLARQVAIEKAYVVRVADEDSWELLENKRERARLAAQCFSKSKKPRASYHPHSEQPQRQSPIFQPMSLQNQFGGSLTVPPQTAQMNPQFLYGGKQPFNLNTGVSSPVQQQPYSSSPYILKRVTKTRDSREER
ncbi:10751_t:CDS:2 [Racocetra persica]|uniref:10751_t:CDS:1 n=1 Tax=Racocetra persica TaxID=160502 RepID=A0ACA9KZQ5_9GLOM|nr:10751_t:CDS:2 [Racocetra persica]